MGMVLSPSSPIAVAGAGSIGCYVGGRLAAAKRDVSLLLRPRLAEAIARHGLSLGDLEGGEATIDGSAVKLATDPSALATAAIVLVTVKCGDTAAMAELIARNAPSHAVVVSLQNGVSNAEILGDKLAPLQRAVAGMVPFNVVATRREGEAPRFFRATGGKIRIARGVAGLSRALDVGGAAVSEHGDMPALLWGKLLLNLNNALNALSDLPLAVELADRRWRGLLAAQIAEALNIMRSSGIKPARIEGVPATALPRVLRLPDFLFRRVARRMLAIDIEARSSMWDDLRLGRTTEIDHLQGAILRLADAAALPAHLTHAIVRLIKAAEAAGAGPPGLQPEEISRAAGPA